MAKKFKIDSVHYEFCFTSKIVKGKYSQDEMEIISTFWSNWADFPLGYDIDHQTIGFEPNDGCCYVDSIDELVPPMLTPADKQRLIAEIKKHLIKL
ncbi:hypothetical protein [Limosilactobacillus ingluviei]|uniref:hypothetical protein n=1 Tax=Limosilactobacillus ingluviei TaxID=148604 RepID=UPI0005939465|nr:hypothetical protein [Limosilactobacillus ingluviei]